MEEICIVEVCYLFIFYFRVVVFYINNIGIFVIEYKGINRRISKRKIGIKYDKVC